MIVWPSNYHRVLLPPITRRENGVSFTRAPRVVLRQDRDWTRPRMMKDENYSAALVRNLRQSRVSVMRSVYVSSVFEDTAQAGNSHLMRLHT